MAPCVDVCLDGAAAMAPAFSRVKPEPLQGLVRASAAGDARRAQARIMFKRFSFFLGALAMCAASPISAAPRGDEPVAVPRAIKQGVDFVYVDPEMSTVAKRRQRPQNWLGRILS